MANPRIVRGRRGTEIAFAARGHVLGETFLIEVGNEVVKDYDRFQLENRLLEEARCLIHQAEQEGTFAWERHHFARNADFAVWEKTLSSHELDRLME